MSALRAGYGEAVITPPPGTELTGFGFYLNRRAESVLDDLKARALYLDDQSDQIVIISCDLLGFRVSDADRIRFQTSLRLGLPVRNILLTCTHTHSGPATAALTGLGKVNSAYVRRLPQAILKAVELAARSAAPAELGWATEAVEPIGFNRRHRGFEEIDPWLKVAVIRQNGRRLYLLNYACHAVTLGPTTEVSADWPGALIKEMEEGGDRGLFVQGFCGDIDPVAYLNRRLGANSEDLRLYGKILAARARKAERRMTYSPRFRLQAAERRIRLPLLVPRRCDLEREVREALESPPEFPKTRLIIRRWEKRVDKYYPVLRLRPWMENIPLQALSIGGLRLLGIPGEVFCRYGLELRKKWPDLMTAGYANGDIGYLPTQRAFKKDKDYACYFAPKFYALFPFSPAIESILLRESREILSSF